MSDYQQNGSGVGTQSIVNFTNGFAVSNAGGKIVVDGSGFVHTTGTESVAGDKTFSGNNTYSGSSTFSGAITQNSAATTTTATQINATSVTSGQALNVTTGAGLTTGSPTNASTRGFFYDTSCVTNPCAASNTYAGATTFANSGNFSGTLVALTADTTTSGTILGISAQSLTNGKAIDVSLGTLYSGTNDPNLAGYNVGAVNVRAQSFTGNILNVEAHGAGGASANLARFTSTQLAGQVLNVTATSLTTGRALSLTLGTGGTGIYMNTGAYTGNLVQLQVNSANVLTIDQTGKITGPASGNFVIDAGNAAAINIGGTTANAVNIGSGTAPTSVLGTLNSVGNLTVGAAGTPKLTVTAASGNVASEGTGQFGSTAAGNNQIKLLGAATGLPVQVSALGSDTNVGIQLVPKGTGRVSVSANGLDVTGTLTTTSDVTVASTKFIVTASTGDTTHAGFGLFGNSSTNQVKLLGAATGLPVQVSALGTDTNIGIQLLTKGTGGIWVPDGTAAAPGLTFTTQQNLGLYRAAADVLGVAAGGVRAADFRTVASAVNFLSISPAATGNAPTISVANSADTNVGITLAPKGTGQVTISGLGQGVVLSSATGALSSLNGTTGQVLTANTGAAPTWTTLTATKVLMWTAASGTPYTPTAGTKALYIECVGGGGGGAGSSTASGQSAWGGGGGAGSYSAVYVASPAGSYAMSIGALGAGGVNTTGSAGGNTTVGSTICVANGGAGGIAMASGTSVSNQSGGLGGTAGVCTPVCDISNVGEAGGYSTRNGAVGGAHGAGGSSPFGAGGPGRAQSGAGVNGSGFGSGGSGSGTNGGLTTTGGAGTAGVVRITEFR